MTTTDKPSGDVLVPASDLARLEQARKGIWDALGRIESTQEAVQIFMEAQNHTAVIWEIANRKYPSPADAPELVALRRIAQSAKELLLLDRSHFDGYLHMSSPTRLQIHEQLDSLLKEAGVKL